MRFLVLFVGVIVVQLSHSINVVEIISGESEAIVGETVQFTCGTTYTVGDDIFWSKFKGDEKLFDILTGSPPGFEVHTSNNSENIMSTLRILKAEADDAGSYVCNHLAGGVIDSRARKDLTVTYEGLVTFEGSRVIQEGININLTCIVDGSSEYNVTWMRNGITIPSDSLTNIRVEGSSLLIDEPTYAQDAGRYVCNSYYNTIKVSAEVTLGADIKIKAPTSVKFTEGERARFECTALFPVTDPVPTFIWMYENTTLEYTNTRFSLEEPRRKEPGQLGTILHMTDTVKEDTGDYTCVFKSNVTEVEHTMVLRVRDRLAALWPFIGIMSEVVLLIIIIFIHEKCTQGDDIGEEDEDDDDVVEPTKEKEKLSLDGEGDMRMKSSNQ